MGWMWLSKVFEAGRFVKSAVEREWEASGMYQVQTVCGCKFYIYSLCFTRGSKNFHCTLLLWTQSSALQILSPNSLTFNFFACSCKANLAIYITKERSGFGCFRCRRHDGGCCCCWCCFRKNGNVEECKMLVFIILLRYLKSKW